MPKLSNRTQVIDSIFLNATLELVLLGSTNQEDEDRLHDNLIEDVELALQFKCGFISKVPKQKLWLDDVLPNYDELRFKQAIRVSREDFETLLGLIQDNPIFLTSRTQFPVHVQLAISLYRFGIYGTGASVQSVARLFGVGDGSSVIRFTRRVIKAFYCLKDKYIYWPNEAERKEIVMTNFESLPWCLGFIDGTHIPLEEAPKNDKDSYYDKDKRYSLQVQLICDHNKKIRHFVVGYPGSVHDSRVWNECSVALNLPGHFTDEQWIGGDKGYGLSKNLITPFRENSKVSAEIKKKFNRYFASQRVKIEHVNGILKEVFSSLKELRIRIDCSQGHQNAVDWITTCLIIYNILMPRGSFAFEEEQLEGSIPTDDPPEQSDRGSDDFSAEDKRISLYYFFQEKLQ